MISVGSRDGGKGVDLRFGRESMEETELEEGEACCNDDENNSSTIDPDVALSYLDEKLQDVLGHFQKDFEGGVSAENLGAKFGGYGSFLPAYQRSPSWSRSRTPPEYDHYGSRSLDNGHLQNGQTNSLYSSPEMISSNSVTGVRPNFRNDQGNQGVHLLPNHDKELTSKPELPKFTNLSDQKTLKVRIKVGNDNLSSRKNAEIYSGLGLDVSPSSSLNESPSDSEGLHYDLLDITDESLTDVIQIMTSASLLGNLLLSPLSDELIRLTEKESPCGDSESKDVDTSSQGSYRMVANGPDLKVTDTKMSHVNKPKLIEQRAISVPTTNSDMKYISHAKSFVPRTETQIDTLSCEELISSTLKLPLLSDAELADLKKDSVKSKVDTKASITDQVRNDSFSHMVQKEPSEPVAPLENGWANKSTKKSSLSGKSAESRKAQCFNENLAYLKKEVSHTDKKDDLGMKNEACVGEDEFFVRAVIEDNSQQRVVEKNKLNDEDSSKLIPGEFQLSSGIRKGANGNQSIVAHNVKSLEDGTLNNSVMLQRSTKSSNLSCLTSKCDSEDLSKGLVKAADRHKECLGDLELEKDNHNVKSEEIPSVLGKISELVEKKSIHKSSNILKEKAAGKKSEEPSGIDHRLSASNMTHLARNVFNPDAGPTAVAPLLNDDWVCCDKCQKWRLLPLGTNPKGLPEKWVCSMLDWLPGMNHCSISEDDTSRALRAAQASAASGIKHIQCPLSSTNELRVSSGDAYQCSGFQGTTAVNKNHAAKDVENETNQENFPLIPNSKKRLQESSKIRSLNDIDKSPLINEFGYHHAGQSSVSLEDRCGEENNNIPGNSYSDKADTLKSKIKNKVHNDEDGRRASKKMKMGDSHLKDENCASDLREASSKAASSSNHGLSNSAMGKDHHDSSHFRNSKGDRKKLSGSCEMPEVPNLISSADGSQLLAMHDHHDYLKKRKAHDPLNSDVNDMPLPCAENHSLGSGGLLKKHHEMEERREKKARVFKGERKDRKGNKDKLGTAEKVSGGTNDILGHDLVSTASQRSSDAADPLRRDLGTLQPSVAATSSSSKVSSSHRSKASSQEMKDSPVESVSSSPLRTSNMDQFSYPRRDAAAKADFQDAGLFVRSSPRISVHDEPILDTDQPRKMSCIDNLDLLRNVKNRAETSPDFTAQQLTNGNISAPDQWKQNAYQVDTLDEIHNETERKKAGKGFSSLSKEKNQVSRSIDNGTVKRFEQIDEPLYEEKSKAGSTKSQGNSGISCDRIAKSSVAKKGSGRHPDHRNCKEEISSKIGIHDGEGASGDVISCQDTKQKVLHDSEIGRPLRSVHFDKTAIEGSEKGKSNSIRPSLRYKIEATTDLQPVVELNKEKGECANGNDERSKTLKQPKGPEKPNGNQQMSTRNSNTSARKGRAAGAPSPVQNPSSQAVTSAVREAKDLKHLADRLKNSGLTTESTGLYFQAALKFLHGAFLLESCGGENTKQTNIQSMQMYSSTAKLCEFCAHEYEKSKDMAAAALAYKCVEVAYMRVIYTSHTSTSKDRNELQTSLQLIPTGDSPSSSASDIDNLNNAAIVDKAIASKGVNSPQVAGAHVLTAHNRNSCLRLLQYAQEVTLAMEASRKSRIRLGEVHSREGVSSVKKALDFSFHDMDGLLCLIRVAVEAINR